MKDDKNTAGFRARLRELVEKGPGYWPNEQSGVLSPVVKKYLKGGPLSPNELGIMRAYLRQWVGSPVWDGNPHADADSRAELNALRGAISQITDQARLEEWFQKALGVGMDPL